MKQPSQAIKTNPKSPVSTAFSFSFNEQTNDEYTPDGNLTLENGSWINHDLQPEFASMESVTKWLGEDKNYIISDTGK